MWNKLNVWNKYETNALLAHTFALPPRFPAQALFEEVALTSPDPSQGLATPAECDTIARLSIGPLLYRIDQRLGQAVSQAQQQQQQQRQQSRAGRQAASAAGAKEGPADSPASPALYLYRWVF